MDVIHLVVQVRKASEEVYKELGSGYNESIYVRSNKSVLKISLEKGKIK